MQWALETVPGVTDIIFDADRRLRDVVALSTLPAIWTGAEPLRIAESLAAALFTTLRPAFTYVSFADDMGRPTIAVAQTDRYETDPKLAEQKAFEAGFDHHLVKAASVDALYGLLMTVPAGTSEVKKGAPTTQRLASSDDSLDH